MKKITILFFTFLCGVIAIYGQQERKIIRKGNGLYEKESFDKSEIMYRKALDISPLSKDSEFNLGDALFKQGKYEESTNIFQNLVTKETNGEKLGAIYHNLGNSYLLNNKLEESIDAYKQALRKSPNDMATKYNLAYAQNKLKQQQDQQNKDDKNKDNKDNKDKKDDQNKDNKDKNDDQNKDNKDKNDDQNKDKKDQQDKNKPQPQQGKLSKEAAERILQALANDEKAVQQKVKEEAAKKIKVKVKKNW